jgi:HEAT repeats
MLITNPVVAASLGLLLLLGLVVLGKRVLRARAERRSRSRRARWLAAIGAGPGDRVRTDELRRLARHARRSLAGQDDLLFLLQSGDLSPADPRRHSAFLRALRGGGLERALMRSVGSRRAIARGRGVLLIARLGLQGSVSKVAPLMRDPDADVRAAATWAMALISSPESVWALLHALRRGEVDPDRVVERLGTRRATRPLLDALELSSFAPVRGWIAEALGLAGGPEAAPALISLLGDTDEEVRLRACRALAGLAAPSSLHALIQAMRDESAAVRSQAARALGALGDEAAASELLKALGDPSWWVRGRASEALLAIGELGQAALRSSAKAHPDRYARDRAVEALRAAA